MSAQNANLFRRLTDAALIKTKALPAANAANFTDALDLESRVLGPVADFVELEISVESLPALVDDKSATFTVKDSADGVNFAAIPGVGNLVLVGAGGVGVGASKLRVRLPGTTRRYLRLDAAVEAAGGNNTAKFYTLTFLANN